LYNSILNVEDDWELSSVNSENMFDKSQETTDPGNSPLILDHVAVPNEASTAGASQVSDTPHRNTDSKKSDASDLARDVSGSCANIDQCKLNAAQKTAKSVAPLAEDQVKSEPAYVRLTRSRGPVEDEPRVQSKTLEYKSYRSVKRNLD
jgi:hypothetical protein